MNLKILSDCARDGFQGNAGFLAEPCLKHKSERNKKGLYFSGTAIVNMCGMLVSMLSSTKNK